MKALLVTILTTGAIQVANLASGLLAARLLQPEGRGELAIAILWPSTMAYLLLFGLSDAVLYYSANRQERPERVFAAGLWLGLGLSGLAMLIGQWLVIPLAYAHQREDTIELAHALLWLIPLHILGLVFQEMLRGQHRMGAWNALRVMLGVGYVLFILVMLIVGPASVDGFGLAYLASHVPPMLGALGLCLLAGWGGWRLHAATARRLLGYGARIHVGAVVAMLNARVDQMVIAWALNPSLMGLYVVAVTVSQITATLANSVAMVAWPRAAASSEADRPVVIGRFLRLTLVLMIGTTVVLFVAAPWLVALLFGPSFADAVPVVRVLLLGALPIAIKEFFVLTFKAYDRALAISKGELATLAVNAALLAALIPPFGLLGAAAAYAAARWVVVLYLARLLRRELGLHLMPLLTPTRDDWDAARRGLRALGIPV